MDDVQKQAEGYVEWVNDFRLGEPVETLLELADGEIVVKLLSTYSILAVAHRQNISTTTSLLSKTYVLVQAMRADNVCWTVRALLIAGTDIRNAIEKYIVNVEEQDYLAPEGMSHVTDVGMVQFFKLLAFAAVYSVDRLKIVTRLQELSNQAKEAVMRGVVEVSVDKSQFGSSVQAATQSREPEDDKKVSSTEVIELRDQVKRLTAQNDALKRVQGNQEIHIADLSDRFSRLRDNNEILQARLMEAQSNNASKKARKDNFENQRLEESDRKIQEQEDLLAMHEGKLEELQSENSDLKRKVARFKTLDDDLRRALEELNAAKAEKDDLARSNQSLESYRRKFKDLQDMQDEIQSLRKDLAESREREKKNRLTTEAVSQHKAKSEIQKTTIFERDMEIADLSRAHAISQEQLQRLKNQHEQDSHKITQLEERIFELESSPERSVKMASNDLEAELRSTTSSQVESEIAALKAKLEVAAETNESQLSLINKIKEENMQLRLKIDDRQSAYDNLLAEKEAVDAALKVQQATPSTDDQSEKLTDILQKEQKAQQLLALRMEHIEKQNAIIKELQARLLRAERGEAQKTNETVATPNEYRLMAAAWHLLNSKLSWSSVMLMRKVDMPSSWLQRQRQTASPSASVLR